MELEYLKRTKPDKPIKGQKEDLNKKCFCQRCKKKMGSINFYAYKDGSKCQICKSCLTAHIDNFNPDTFEWILEKMDVPYIPAEWNVLRDRAFQKDPYKMNGMSVIGKYLGKMRLNQYSKYGYADTEALLQERESNKQKKSEKEKKQQKQFEQQMKKQLEQGSISQAQYKTLVSVETQNEDLFSQATQTGNAITGQFAIDDSDFSFGNQQPTSYEEALRKISGTGGRDLKLTQGKINNPFQEENFIPQEELSNSIEELSKDDKVYLALKWGRLYTADQWIYLEKLYNEFMASFDVQGAARIDTLKMICKTSLKMNEAIDIGDIESYQKLSRVYDSLMKSAKFTQAQNKDGSINGIDSASAIVDFVQAHSGNIPRYVCKQPRDLVDKIILDLKKYTKNLIYEDKSLAQQIEKYLQSKAIAQQMRKDKITAIQNGQDFIQISDEQILKHRQHIEEMKKEDEKLYKEEQ